LLQDSKQAAPVVHLTGERTWNATNYPEIASWYLCICSPWLLCGSATKREAAEPG
jgi:hypothetical protein